MTDSVKEIRRFETLADDGSRHEVIESQNITLTRSINGVALAWEGPTRFALVDGSLVNRIEDKTYKVLRTGQVLRDIG